MTLTQLNGNKLTQMIVNGSNHLANQSKMIDALNVFPVPDGDTGTNMNLSMVSGVNQLKTVTSDDTADVSAAFAKGLLMGARGNSGVILSQLFRGFSKAVEGKKVVKAKDISKALENGVETAYKAVMNPVEGTILTVAKDAATRAGESSKTNDDLIVLFDEVVDAAKNSLRHTPELLPVLKEAGVVDSGGQGLVTIYEGFLSVLTGKDLAKKADTIQMDEMVRAEHHKVQANMRTEDIHYGYCTEFMVKLDQKKLQRDMFDEKDYRQELSKHGDSLLVVSDDELVKVHVHTETPGNLMTYSQRYGELINIKIENMRQQHLNILEASGNEVKQKPNTKKAPYAIIAVAIGDGIEELFKSVGAQIVIKGGQTMNPSTEDIVSAIHEANAEHIMILPNNSNIFMSAKQAGEVVDEEVAVIPSKTIPQGMEALLAFHPDADFSENEQNMSKALENVKSGQVTFAVRDTTIEGVAIKKDDFIGIADGKIVTSDPDQKLTSLQLIEKMIDEDTEIVTIIYGEDVTKEEVDQLEATLEESYQEIEIEVLQGKQPVYAYIISIE